MKSLALPHHPHLGLLLIRLALGAVFIVHGWLKWDDLEMTMKFFTRTGLPEWLVYVVAAIELLGGIAVLIGFKTRMAGYLIALVMLGAIFTVKLGAGFVGGWEFDAMLLAAAVGLALTGAGKYSVDKK